MPDTRSVAARAFPWVLWLLTFHILGVALLFGYFRLSMTTVQWIASWKEIAALALLGTVAVRVISGRGGGARLAGTDLFAAGWIVLALVFLATENVLLRDFVPAKAAIFGVRDAAFFVILYFVGRATPELGDDYRVMKTAFYVLAVTSAIAVAEQLLVTPQMLVAMGVAAYVQNFLGVASYTQGNIFGLPDNYWSEMGGHFVRRSGSVFLSSQGFAMIFIVLMPLATLWLLRDERSTRWRYRIIYLIIWAGLIATFTRTAIVTAALQAMIVFIVRRRVTGAALTASVALIVFIVALLAFPSLANFVIETLTWQTGSSGSHLKDWIDGTLAFLEQPWGYGLGTTDQTAVRAGLEPLTADNVYLKYAVELGLPGLIFLLGTLFGIATAGLRTARMSVNRATADFGIAAVLIMLGVAIYGMTSAMFNDPIVGYFTFWIGGTAVTLAQRVPSPVAQPAAHAIGYA